MSISRRRFVSLCGGVFVSSMLAPRISFASTPLQARAIPKTGEKLPVIGLGTYQAFDISGSGAELEQGREVLRRFVNEGGRLVDSSPMYGNAERVIGQLAKETGTDGKLFLATKVWTNGEQSGVSQMQESMNLLGRKTLDLMQVHNLVDLETHIVTMKKWKAAGRLRYIGVSHYVESAHNELEQALRKHRDLDFVQLNYSLAEPEAEQRFLPAAADLGVAVIINRPFAQGGLFGQVRGKPLPSIAKEIECDSWAQFFLKYIVGHPAVTATIPATRKLEHLVDNMQAGRGVMPNAQQRATMRQQFLAV
jgi:diketogulonate reductase-like aldo/keto reductase